MPEIKAKKKAMQEVLGSYTISNRGYKNHCISQTEVSDESRVPATDAEEATSGEAIRLRNK